MDKPPFGSSFWFQEFATISEEKWEALRALNKPHILGLDFGADGGCAVEGFRGADGLIYITDVTHCPPTPPEDS